MTVSDPTDPNRIFFTELNHTPIALSSTHCGAFHQAKVRPENGRFFVVIQGLALCFYLGCIQLPWVALLPRKILEKLPAMSSFLVFDDSHKSQGDDRDVAVRDVIELGARMQSGL